MSALEWVWLTWTCGGGSGSDCSRGCGGGGGDGLGGCWCGPDGIGSRRGPDGPGVWS